MRANNTGDPAKKSYSDYENNPSFARENSLDHNIFSLQETISKVVRKQTPPRLIYAKGSGAYGSFTVTNNITKYCKSALFSTLGNKCRIFVRFSGFGSEKGNADTAVNARGFAIKFYTEEGNWDIVGASSPVYFLKNPLSFAEFLQAQARQKDTNLKDPTLKWDFYSMHPETLHELLIQLSNRGIPHGYRHMNGYGANTYSMTNENQERFWVKFHFKTKQGIKNISAEDAKEMVFSQPDFAQEDLCTAITSGNFPKWTLFIQIMSEDQAREYRWNPFDVTKVWLHEDFPLIEVGELQLSKIAEPYLDHVEQAAFSPANTIEGIGLSPDPMLQARLYSYADAQRYRIGSHADLLEVNRCIFSKKDEKITNTLQSQAEKINTNYTEKIFNENEDDHFSQPGLFYTRALQDLERETLIQNIIFSMNEISGPRREEIISRQLCHYFRANIELGMKVTRGLDINIDANMINHASSI